MGEGPKTKVLYESFTSYKVICCCCGQVLRIIKKKILWKIKSTISKLFKFFLMFLFHRLTGILWNEKWRILCVSEVFQDVITLWAGHPVWGPRGFNAGSVLQQAVIFGQFRITPHRQPIEKTHHVTGKSRLDCSFTQINCLATHPKRNAQAMLGKTITSAREKAPARYEPADT